MLEQRLDALKQAISRRHRGEFHFPEIYGPGWDGLYIGDKVKLGREFLNSVRKGRFVDVKDTGRKTETGRVYRKI
ncbi:DUF1413 domain-containing protein [Bradyrhizobium cenepequi]